MLIPDAKSVADAPKLWRRSEVRNQMSEVPRSCFRKKARGSSVLCFVGLLVVLNPVSLAVTSKLTRHSTQADFLKGETENVIIDSRGTIRLARAWSQLAADFKKVWAINTIVADGQTLFLGTSPNGRIYKYHDGRLTKIYPPEPAVVEDSGARGMTPT